MNLASIKYSLASVTEISAVMPSHVAAFCLFISPWQKELSSADFHLEQGTTEYQSCAANGFLLITGNDNKAAFLAGAEHLAGRTYFTGTRAARFEIDGVALLGVALGYRAANADLVTSKWLFALLEQAIKVLADDTWQVSLVKCAKAVLAATPDWSASDPVLTVSLRAVLGQTCTKAEQNVAWLSVLSDFDETDPARRASLQGVFEVCTLALSRLPVHGAGVPELIAVLEGVAQSMSHWTYENSQRVKNRNPQKWEIDNEYHVQNLLWTVLRPIFPDLVEEESLKKLGHTTPRLDLGVPSLHTIIEVKYMRKQGQRQLKKVTDEIAADRSLYLRNGTGYTSMIAFIWDECRQTESYKTLCNGLESLGGIEKVIILPRPAKMERGTLRP